ncbi:MAG: family 78 glycoside hydrolase catalytic domain [Planctomycetes bacterium]|nr:family 78 glycoside hydrolase catalytic domain [Planctomycetota bacterium]
MIHNATLSALALAFVVCAAADAQTSAPGAPRNLRTEYKTNPIGIDTAAPRFAWELGDDRRGAQQTAYQILVSDNPDNLARELGDSWSIKLPGRETNQVAYAGRELLPWRTYHWIVRTWDLSGTASGWSAPASFTMGPLRAADWQASWIASEAPSTSPKGGYLGYHSTYSSNADDFHYVQIDLGTEGIFDNIVIHPARPHGDPNQPGVLFPLRMSAYVDGTPSFDAKFMRAGNKPTSDIPNPGAEPFVINTTRFKIRYIRIVIEKKQQDGDKGFAFALGEIEVRDGSNNIAPTGVASASDSLEEGGWSVKGLNDRVLVPGHEPPVAPKPVTLLRKPFSLSSPPKRALVAASALGVFDMTINGQRVSDERLAPGWTDYTQRVPYVMYDVTRLLAQGDNVIGVSLADGWYAGRVGTPNGDAANRVRGIYGSTPRFICQLHVEHTTGAMSTYVSDASWKWSPSGQIRRSDLIDGEAIDWRSEQRGWDGARFADEGWKPAVPIPDGPALFARSADPIREGPELKAIAVTEPSPRTFIYDFGQVITGVARIHVDLKEYATVHMRYAEALDDKGLLYRDNLRTAQQTDQMTLRPGMKGGFDARFTTHGFRYVEVTGNIPPATLDLITAVPISSATPEVSRFECSDPMLTQLWHNLEWTRRNNIVGLPTDGPQRDERLGRMGDTLTFAHTAMYQADLAATFGQWLGDVRLAQRPTGSFSDLAPHPEPVLARTHGTPGFADAGVFVPWEMYLHYHDKRVLEASLDSMLRWIQFVQSRNPSLVWKEDRGADLSDLFDATTLDHAARAKAVESVPKDLFATAFFARSCELAAKSAFACSKFKDAERLSKLAAEVRATFRRTFIGPDGRMPNDSQAGYALALEFDMFAEDRPGEARAVDNLVRTITDAQDKLTTGMHTSHRALLALSRHGHHALALKLATRRDVPSWGYAVSQGATTIWERFDGYVAGRGFADADSNSLDSFAFGAVGEWMMRTIGGIDLEDRHLAFGPVMLEPVLDGPTKSSAEGPRAFEHVRLRPMIDGLTWARCEHASIAGRFKIAWKREGDVLTYECTIPPNTSATLDLPAMSRDSITEGGEPIDKVKGLQFWSCDGRVASLEVQAGTYHFVSRLK